MLATVRASCCEKVVTSFAFVGGPKGLSSTRLRQGVPSRRRRRKAANTRIVSAGGWPQAPSRGGAQESITVAIRRKIRMSKAVFPSLARQTWVSASQHHDARHSQHWL